jgi:hypothetical protein
MGQVEDTFGEYRSGMRRLVAEHIEDHSESFRDLVFVELARTYKNYWPPSLAEILAIERELAGRPPEVPLLSEPPISDLERQEVQAGLQRLLDDLSKKKRARPKDRRGGAS